MKKNILTVLVLLSGLLVSPCYAQKALNDKLVRSACEGNLSGVQEALAAGADINAIVHYEKIAMGVETNALGCAVFLDRLIIVKELLKHKKTLNINLQGLMDETALMTAVERTSSIKKSKENEEIFNLLLADENIDATLTDYDGNTALMLAAKIGHLKFVKKLLKYRKKHDVNIFAKNKYGNNVLLVACDSLMNDMEDRIKIIDLLATEYPLLMAMPNNEGKTALAMVNSYIKMGKEKDWLPETQNLYARIAAILKEKQRQQPIKQIKR